MPEDRYEIREKIGQGGIGAVYRAWDRRLNREVAIKRVLPEGGFETQGEAIEHLLKEATSLSSVQHPHIVTVYDAGVDDEGPYVVMEILDGRTLDEMVERGTLTSEDFREVAIQTQEALIAAQDLNLVHRDLKPTNVMVTWLASGKFQMKLVDFGLAKFSAKPSLQTIDHGDAVFGSIHFMAPEQFERTPLDQRTDMYSMGCMYHFSLTDRHPFTGETGPEVMASHLQHRVVPLHELRPDLPRWLCDWVMWHIERKMDDRPANARGALQRFLQGEQHIAERPPQPVIPKPIEPPSPVLGTQPPQPVLPGVAAPPGASASLPAPGEVPTGTAPQPIEPPPGQPPVHTTTQVQVTKAPQPPAATPSPSPAKPAAPVPPKVKPVQVQPAASQPPAPAAFAPPPAAPVRPAATPVPGPAAGSRVAPTVQPLTPASRQPAPAISGTGTVAPLKPASSPAQVPSAAEPSGSSAPDPALIASNTTTGRKGLSQATKVTIAVVLAIAIVITGIVVLGNMDANREIQRINALLAQVDDPNAADLPTSAEEARLLLAHGSSLRRSKKREAFYQRLLVARSSDGSDLDASMAAYAANENNPMVADIRVKFFQVLQGRRGPTALPYLIEHASTTDSPVTATAALEAADKTAGDRELPALLKIIQFTDHETVRRAAKSVIASVVERSTQREDLVPAINNAYETATTDEARLALIELLGSVGGGSSARILAGILEDGDKNSRLAALAALAAWPDDSQFDTLLDALRKEEDPHLRTRAFESALGVLRIDRSRQDPAKMWGALASVVRTKPEKIRMINTLATLPDDWVVGVVKSFLKDENDDVSFRAERALEHLEERRK